MKFFQSQHYTGHHNKTEISDHHLLFVELESLILQKIKMDKTMAYKKINQEMIKQKISNCNIFDTNSNYNINENYNKLIKRLNEIIVEATTEIKYTKKRTFLQPWIDNDVIALIKRKNYWYKKHMNNITNKHNKKNYKFWLNKLTNLKRKKKNMYYEKEFSNHVSDQKKTWKTVIDIINDGKCNQKQNNFLDKNMSNEQKIDKLNSFNKFYCEIGKKLADNIRDNNIYTVKNRTSSRFEFNNITNEETIKIITNLNNTNLMGPDDIQTNVIKNNKKELAPYISSIINTSFNTAEVPDQMKVSKVVPIYKKGNIEDMNSFRPISISSIFSKIIETHVNHLITDYLRENNLMSCRQYGFRQNSNTTSALFDVVNLLQINLDNKKKVAAVFCDLTKAFDTVDRKILLKILFECGIRGTANKWFENYLSERKQFVENDDIRSNMKEIDYGVIQGSPLGPSLFSLYISSLSDLGLKGDLFLYADDIVLIYHEDSYKLIEEKANKDMEILHQWMCLHKLTVNTMKTKYMLFKSKKEININLRYNNFNIEKVYNFKYLGVIIDEDINWNLQVCEMKKKCRRIVGIFRRISQQVPEKIKRPIYFNLFYSKISYGLSIWGNTSKQNIKKLQSLQNKAIQNIFALDYRTSTKCIHEKYNILELTKLHKLLQIEHIHKINNNNIINNTSIIYNSQIHNHDTRSSNNIRNQSTRTHHFGLNSIFNTSTKFYNEIPPELKIFHKKQFKSTLRKYLSRI